MRLAKKLNSLVFGILVGQVSSQIPSKPTLVPLIAEYETIKRQDLVDGNALERAQKGMYYRDSQGRTRMEMGRFITISDPVAGVHVLLDTQLRVARRIDREKMRAIRDQARQTKSVHLEFDKLLGEKRLAVARPLGTKVIEGLTCEGKELTSTIPSNSVFGNQRSIEIKTEIWIDAELHLPILVTNDNPLAGRIVQRFKNIKKGVDPDPNLFRIPEGYKVVGFQAGLQ